MQEKRETFLSKTAFSSNKIFDLGLDFNHFSDLISLERAPQVIVYSQDRLEAAIL